ncbi:DUF1800 domain-containing protein [Caulobacter sp. KR2-114]|uniref:DUF1800 domain-containing protein n=1 Tax=Caulobacter sp. KR2-114 TaxID=3400912 RepID=UPI003C03930D
MPSYRPLPLLLIATALAAAPAGASAAAPPPPGMISARDLAFLNRVTWGANQADAEALVRDGRSRWLARQLQPAADDALPAAAQAQLDGLAISHLKLKDEVQALEAQNKAANQLTDPDQKKAAQQAYQQAMNDLARQAATRDLLRDLYAPDQVREQMTWFWFNHFNVHAAKANIRAMVGDYEDSAIRPHALGRFRDLLEATLRHPAMLRYLDNADNAAGHINENYARELLELHTMGVGSGYSQKDVQELARILTGVGIDARAEDPKVRPQMQDQLIRDGLFEFNPNRHDYGDKVLLGHTIKGRGFAEVEEALDIIARQPATARHVSGQIASYFMGDNPPPALVGRMAETFQHSDGDIAKVLATLFQSPEFNASLGTAFKDPAHYAVSAVRLAYNDRVILNAQPIQGWLNRMAEGLYNHETPDGYPVAAAAWDGPGQMAMRFEIARQIGAGAAGLFKPDTPGATEAPAFPQIENALYFNAIAPTMGPKSVAALGQAVSPQDWNTLFLSSPEFMRR